MKIKVEKFKLKTKSGKWIESHIFRNTDLIKMSVLIATKVYLLVRQGILISAVIKRVKILINTDWSTFLVISITNN